MKNYLTWKDKQEIVQKAYDVANNVKSTAREYNISPAQIRRWKKALPSLSNADGNAVSDAKKKKMLSLKMIQRGRPRKDADMYNELKSYYENLRNMDRIVTVGMLCYELKRLKPDLVVDFNVLRKRIYRWLSNEQIVQRRVTHVAQNTRYVEETMTQFVTYVNEQIITGGFLADDIVNIDETNIQFDMTGSVTLANQGTRTISVRSSGASSRCTVLLGVTLSGRKLPPFIIFKGKSNGRISREWTGETSFPSDCMYAVQEKAWIDEKTFLEWVHKVWSPFTFRKKSSYLLMDECTVHLMGSCLHAIQNCGTEIDFIVRGYTSKLQVCDVGVNKPFKDYVKQHYEHFMIVENGRKAKRIDVANWISKAWSKINADSIVHTWKSVGITCPQETEVTV